MDQLGSRQTGANAAEQREPQSVIQIVPAAVSATWDSRSSKCMHKVLGHVCQPAHKENQEINSCLSFSTDIECLADPKSRRQRLSTLGSVPPLCLILQGVTCCGSWKSNGLAKLWDLGPRWLSNVWL